MYKDGLKDFKIKVNETKNADIIEHLLKHGALSSNGQTSQALD